MHNRLCLSATLILMLASLAPAAIQQSQGVGIDGVNSIALADTGVVSSVNFNATDAMQTSSGHGGLVTALNYQVGVLGQAAGLGGMGGIMGIHQEGSGLLNQTQAQGGYNLGTQFQNAAIGLNDNLTRLSGVGTALALQAFMGAQVQVLASPFGISVNVNIPVATTSQVAHY